MLSKLTEQSIYLVREEISRANKIGDEKLSQSSIFGGAGNESKFNKNKCVSRRAESVVSAITDEKGGRTGTSTRQSKYNAEYTDKGGNGNQGGKVDEEVNVSKYIQNDMTIEEEIRKELGDLNGRDKRRLLDNQRKYGPGLKHDSSTQSEYKLTAGNQLNIYIYIYIDREEEKYLEQPIVKVNQTTLHLEKQIKKKRRKVNARVGGVFQFQGSWEKENNIEKKVIKYPEMRGGRYENELFPEGDIMRNVRIDTRIAESRPHVEKHQRALTSSSIPRSFGFLESEDISKYYPDPNNWIKRASKERGESNLLIWKDKLSEMRDNLRGLEADYNSLRGIKVDCIGSGNEGDIKSPRGQRTKTEYGNHPQTKYNGGFKPSFLDYEIHSKFTLNPNKPKNSLNRLVLRGKMGARTQIHTGGLYAEMGMGVTHMGGRLGGPGGPGRPGGPGEMGSFSFMSNSTNYGGDHSRQFSDGAWVKRRIYTKHVPSTAPGRHTRTVSQKPNITAIHSPNITPMF